MPTIEALHSLDFPDDPLKWKGWENYRAENLYDRLCLNPADHPNHDQIQQHCSALLRWWQKKLPLKNQPSNPLAHLLGRGMDEAARFLVDARTRLLDANERRELDAALAAQAQEEALTDFSKYVAFSLARRVLTAEAEEQLAEFGQRNGLTEEQTRACIEEELTRHKAQRVVAPPPPPAVAALDTEDCAEAETDFLRIMRLSNLDLGDATGLVRRIFVTIAENLGIHLERAEALLDSYLDEAEVALVPAAPAPVLRIILPKCSPKLAEPAVPPSSAAVPRPRAHPIVRRQEASRFPIRFMNPIGAPMVLVPGGDFTMGSEEEEAAPNERPVTPVSLSEFYMSRYPVTNAHYELFDPGHLQKRIRGAGADHPVVYVTSLEAVNFCDWLGDKDGRKYRLPTEAEWEYAARGTDGRKYPWGNQVRRGDLANFADASTAFAWRDEHISDGFSETSPVGSFPRGISFFGLDDMAGNVWEWCLDFYQPYPGIPRRNPRGLAAGATRVYRGGSWKSRFSNLRTTARGSNAAIYASNDVGFRVVCECGDAD